MRHIESDDELQALGVGTVVRAGDGTIAARFDTERGVVFGDERPFAWSVLRAPAVVLWPLDDDKVGVARGLESVTRTHTVQDAGSATLQVDERPSL